ncbi:hypothetical protein B0T18DRAFT_424415 [Schizothecium vesticola]|uniref:Peptidase S54 rhomboid domain-containing protein n=1 Tax=Schizothecium vesticola TaxID=314040 RepID=A0AA40FA24_9PEZI|nr:hypothetical protein B0T18DRAFT_424415 [Schizothecium vesticola]
MSGCSLVGVGAFRSSVQIAFQQLPRPSCGRLRVSPSRCFSLRPLPVPHPPLQCQSAPRPTADRRPVWGSLCGFPSRQGVRARSTKKAKYAVITHYVEVPRNYDDATGLPFREEDLGPAEVVKIFGPSLSTADANRLLHIIHGRRVAGTLEDPELRVNTVMFGPKHMNAALEWLRKTVPVDEITNAGLRAEDELAVLEGGVEEEGQDENVEEQKPSGGWLKGKLFKDIPSNDDIYGPSVFDAIRAKNIARHEELLRKQKEADEAKRLEGEAAFQSGELQTLGQRTLGQVRPPPSPQMQKWIDNATSDLDAPPDMTKTQRILPSAVVALLVSGLFVAFAYYYTPPRRSERLWPDIPPAAATVGLLCLANVAVYLAWKAPPLWGVLNRYFVLTPATPRPLQLFGAMFSHQVFAHALVNLVTLWVLGTRFHDEVGRGEFLATYAGAGAVSFLGSLTAIVLRNRLDLTTLGASGAVYGVAAAYFWLHRFEGFKPFGVIPEAYKGVPGVAFIGLAIGLNVAAALSPTTRMDVAAHLVGLAVGVLAAHLIEIKRALRKGVEGKTPA